MHKKKSHENLHEYALGGIRTHEADLLYHYTRLEDNLRPPKTFTCFIRSSPADVKQNKQTLKPCRRQAK